MTSRLMLNLNEPSRIDDTSWIEPGRYIGVWWSIHKKQNTWEMGPKHGATTASVKRYIDFAARHGFSGVLAEGWNPGWGEGEQISYLKAYPDFDIEEVCRYALSQGYVSSATQRHGGTPVCWRSRWTLPSLGTAVWAYVP